MNPTIEKYTEELISTWRINSTQFQTDIYRSILINQKFNPMFNPMFDPIFNPMVKLKFNRMFNPIFSPMFKLKLNPMFNPMCNSMFNPMFDLILRYICNLMVIQKYNPLFNPKFNPMFNPMSNPMFNRMFHSKFNSIIQCLICRCLVRIMMDLFVGECEENSSHEIAEQIMKDGQGVFETTAMLMVDPQAQFERFIFNSRENVKNQKIEFKFSKLC